MTKSPAKSLSSKLAPDTSNGTTRNPYQVELPRTFVWSLAVLALATSFGVGRFSRLYLLPLSSSSSTPLGTVVHSETMPVPILSPCKQMPNFTYVSKYFGTGASSASDNLLVRRQQPVALDGTTQDKLYTYCEVDIEDDDEDDEVHQPSGQHLLVDMKDVNGAFLNSEHRLAKAMLELIDESQLTLLSYHCHRLPPVGVSCVGVLLESHVSFHTWPIEGVITLDLFTCGEGSLLPLLPLLQRLFGIPRPSAVSGHTSETPHMQWSYKYRGFPNKKHTNPEETIDLNQYMMGWMEYDMKNRIASATTTFQTVEVYEVLKRNHVRTLENYRNSLTDPTSHEAQHKELFQPDRVIYLDGIMQSRFYGEAAYHEALVHPGMMAHDHPKRVAIVGGGEGATLREILKHKTVEMVTMVEIDEEMVQLSRKYIPEWSDCSNLKGSVGSCFEDPRAEVFYTDAIAWFIDRFGDGRGKDEDKYDVIIMDALDPSSSVGFSDILYDNAAFAEALTNALNEDGIIIAQTGEDSHIGDPSMEYTSALYEHTLMTHFKNNGFEVAKDYTEAHGGFMGIWRFIIVFKDRSNLLNWYAEPAMVDMRLKERAIETMDGVFPFRFFDGATMATYQFPSRVTQGIFCRRISEVAEGCSTGQGIDPYRKHLPLSAFEVKTSTLENAGRGLFLKEKAEEGALLSFDSVSHSIVLKPITTEIVRTILKYTTHPFSDVLNVYMFGYGFAHDFYGDTGYSVEPSILSFINHGCHGTYNIGMHLSVTEATADMKQMPPELWDNPSETAFYNPYFDRNHLNFMHSTEALRDIDAGEEILDNYLTYLAEDNWETGIADYRAQCVSHKVGAINRYESSAKA